MTEFNYSKLFYYKEVTEKLLYYLLNHYHSKKIMEGHW